MVRVESAVSVPPESRPDLLAQNTETIAKVRARAEKTVGRHQRAIERLTGVIGRPMTIYLCLAAVSLWVGLNVGTIALGRVPLDPPPFFWLQGMLGLCALLTALMVLTTQNRQMRHVEDRAHLDLQVNLSAEQKTAKLVQLLEELRHDLPNVRDRRDPVAEAMAEAVDPHAAITALEETFEAGHDPPAESAPGRPIGPPRG
ncbi:MAG: DUF1003 domain-containing protein [Polyangiales bacterium]